jgi:CheY-like chemotaxis protein
MSALINERRFGSRRQPSRRGNAASSRAAANHADHPVTALPLRLLLVEDSEDDAELITRAFRRMGYSPVSERVVTAGALSAALARPWDVLLCGTRLRCLDLALVLALVRDVSPQPVVIALSGRGKHDPPEQFESADLHNLVSKDYLDDVPAIVTSLLRSGPHGH